MDSGKISYKDQNERFIHIFGSKIIFLYDILQTGELLLSFWLFLSQTDVMKESLW